MINTATTYPKMKERPKRLLVEALRSGKFKQGKQALKRSDERGARYCCLGVLTELAITDGVDIPVRIAPDGICYYRSGDGEIMGTPPAAACEWAGMPDTEGQGGNAWITKMIEMNDHIEINDHLGKSFDEIADWVEENL